MFRVNRGGAAIGYADSLTYIRLHKNGCYIPCEKGEAGGFCAKIAVQGDKGTVLQDEVFQFSEGGLSGTEPIASVEEINGAELLNDYEIALNILGVETEVSADETE